MKAILTFFTAIFSVSLIFSQTPDKPADTQSKIRVFEPSTSAKSASDNYYKWAVKTDIFAILTGEFPIIGEYRIGKKFSVEGSAGITYGYIGNDILGGDEDESDYSGDLLDSETAEMGSAFRLSFKYFPSSDYDAIEGWYFGVQLMNKTTNRGFDNSQYSMSGDLTDKKVKTGAAIIIGKQIFQDSNIVWDFYFGAGICDVKRTYYSYEYVGEEGTQVVMENQSKKSQPNIMLGLRIGFGN